MAYGLDKAHCLWYSQKIILEYCEWMNSHDFGSSLDTRSVATHRLLHIRNEKYLSNSGWAYSNKIYFWKCAVLSKKNYPPMYCFQILSFLSSTHKAGRNSHSVRIDTPYALVNHLIQQTLSSIENTPVWERKSERGHLAKTGYISSWIEQAWQFLPILSRNTLYWCITQHDHEIMKDSNLLMSSKRK